MSFSKITMPFLNPFSKIINSISTIINRNNGPKVLGRWGLEYCPNKVSKKILKIAKIFAEYFFTTKFLKKKKKKSAQ